MEKIGIFILFLGPLVFFHELGHYLFARLFGVRVEVFSLGFGPKLFKFKKLKTEYCVSLIPLGGYVKMFGDDPLSKDEIPQEERKFSFTHQSKWARFWIVLGGPLANFLMAYVIFFLLLFSGEKIPEIKLGVIPEDSQFYEKGIRTGDVLKKVNGNIVYNPSDIALEDKHQIETITVEREGEITVLKPAIKASVFFKSFLKYPPLLRKPLVVDKNGKVYVASFKSVDPKINTSLDVMLNESGKSPLYLYSYSEIKGKKEGVIGLRPERTLKINYKKRGEFFSQLGGFGIRPLDLMVKSVNMNSPADKSGIKARDVFLTLNKKNIYSFEDLRSNLQKTTGKEVDLSLWRDGKILQFKVAPEVISRDGKEIKLIGVYTKGEFLTLNFIQTKSKGFFKSLSIGFFRTWDTTVKTFAGFKKLITGEVSLKAIGGPLAIGKVASDSFQTSLTYFFQLMALISINLGVINLLPIPVLDGGHILFIFVEILNRGPLSRRKMEIAQQVGLSILLMLMVGAIFNDVTRFF